MVDIIAVQPAYWGECTFGNFRFGVYTSAWELAMRSNSEYRVFTHRIAQYPSVDTQDGIAHVQFLDENIMGILVERGGKLPSFAAGVLMMLDATFLTIDPMKVVDHIYDPLSCNEWEIKSIQRKNDPIHSGLAFYALSLELKGLNNLGGI